MKDIFAAIETYLQRRKIPELAEGVVVSAQDGSADVALSGSQGSIRAHYDTRMPLVAGDNCLLVRLTTMPTWVVVARYGSNRLGAYRQQEAVLAPRNLRAYGARTFAVAVWDGQPDVLYEVQCAHTGNQFITVAFVTGSSAVVPMEATSVSVRVRGIARDGYTTNWCAATSAQRSGDATALLQNKGDLLTFGTDLAVLPLGTNGQVLTVDTSADTGLKWAAPTPLTTKGDLLSRTSTELARLPVGANGQILSADSAEPTGLKWINPPATSPLTSKGDLYTHTGTANARLPAGANGQILSVDSAEPTGLKWVAPTPLTTKGDLLSRTSTGLARLPVGSNGQVLIADSAEPTGLKWATPSNSDLPLTAPGDLLTRDGSGLVRLPVGSHGQYLRVNTSNPTKLEWSDTAPPPSGNTIQKRVLLYEFVAVGGETNTFWTITNISPNYRDLIVQTHGRLTTASGAGQAAMFLYYNNDFNTANYRYTIHASNTNHTLIVNNTAPPVWFGYRANIGTGSPSAYETVINRYTSAFFKVSRTIGGEYTQDRLVVDLMNAWLNSAAINRLDFTLPSGYFLEAGFQIRVYGVRDEAEPADANAVLAAPPPIGSTTPSTGAFTTLSTNGAFTAANAVQHTFEGLADGSFNLNVVFDNWGNSAGGPRFIGRKARGTKTSPAAVNFFDELFSLDARGHDGSSYVSNARALLTFRASQDWSGTAQGTEFIMALTPPNSTTIQERIFINGDGEIAQLNANAAFYFGNPFVDGTWRIRRDGNNLVFERRVSGNYIVQFTIPAI